ncbi:hypothetical protein BDW75DRAFT_224157 [Aspergillus navahoensis]
MAFILSVSPRACESFKFSDFVAQHKTRPKILFNDSALFSIWNVAHKHGLATTKRLVQFIQWHTQTPPPVTGADGMGHQYWSLRLSSFAAIQNLFGDIIVDAVRRFPPEAGMYMSDCLPESTTNIWTRIPHQELQDSVICLNIGHALAVADVLFPIGSKKVGSIITANESYDGTPAAASLPNSMETALGPGSPNILQESSLFADDAYFTLRGAHVEALSSIFGTEICRGIGESQLREWEIKQLLVDTTDCVTMQLRREQPHLGILRLRVGFLRLDSQRISVSLTVPRLIKTDTFAGIVSSPLNGILMLFFSVTKITIPSSFRNIMCSQSE